MESMAEQISAIANEINPQPTEVIEPQIDDLEPLLNEPVIDDAVEEPEEAEEAEGEVAQTDDEEISTISGLAEAIGWEAADLYGMNVPMGDGQESVPLGQLKDRYQEALRTETASKARISELETQATQYQGNFESANQVSQQMQQAQAALVSLQNQYQGIDWAEAEQNDPGQAALSKQKFQEAYSQARGQVQQVEQQQQQIQAEHLQKQATRMHELLPSWSDPEIMKQGQKDIKETLTGLGYNEDEINSMADARAVHMLNDYVRLKKLEASSSAAVDKARSARKAPRVLKGGGRAVNHDAVKSLANKATRTGDKTDKFNAVKALLSGS
tara:strand:+ start:759 stop:1742 length:984 start_codon:yes stop_codon:yes gene_type:complete